MAESGGSRVLAQTIIGLGGVGKTTVAAAFAHRYASAADIVWWVQADLPSTLVDDLIKLADRVGIPPLDNRPDRARLLIEFLGGTDRHLLLVFDNVHEDASIIPWIPNRGHGVVLVTSRNRNFDRLGGVLDIDVLPTDVATSFLADRPPSNGDRWCHSTGSHPSLSRGLVRRP